MTEQPEPWIDSDEAARHLGISQDTLYRYAQAGTVPCSRIGPNRGTLRFRRSELDAWVEAGRPVREGA